MEPKDANVVVKKEKFVAAIKINERLIYKIAAIYTNNAEDRDDLVQEIVYQLWKSFDSFNSKSSLSTWMYRVAMNVAIYHLNISKRKIPTVPLDEQLVDFQEADYGGENEKWELMRRLLNDLNLLDKGIVLLYFENKSYEEIAEIIGISASNVGTKLSRIREKLKNKIADKMI